MASVSPGKGVLIASSLERSAPSFETPMNAVANLRNSSCTATALENTVSDGCVHTLSG